MLEALPSACALKSEGDAGEGTRWISGVLVCRPKDPFAVMQNPIAYLFCHDASI